MIRCSSPKAMLLALTLLFESLPCRAQDDPFLGAVTVAVGGLGGTTRERPASWSGGTWAAGTHSLAYAVGYRQRLHGSLSGSLTYLNQGHYDDDRRSNHHSRDDLQVELLVGKRPLDGRVEFNIGGGFAYYSETDRTGSGIHDFRNRQGFGSVITGVVDVDISERLFLEGEVHRHFVWRRYPSTNVLYGMGYRLKGRDQRAATNSGTANADDRAHETPAHSVRFSYGYGILNSTHSESLSNAFQVGYSAGISRNFAATVSFLHEGKAPELNRKGVALQVEGRHSVGGPFALGLGLGPYVNVDHSDFFNREGEASLYALLTVFLDIRISRNTDLSVAANRPRSLTGLKNKPMTDVFQCGLKFRF